MLRAFGVFMTATMLAGCSPSAAPRIIKHVPAVAKGEVQGEVKVGLPTIEMPPPAERAPVKAEGGTRTVAVDGMSLQNAVGIALARHPDIGRANAVVAQSNAQVSIEKAAWFPTISYGVQPGFNRYGGGSSDNGGSALKGTVGANQLIYDFGATSGRIRASEATSEKQRHLLNDTMEQVAWTMAAIFIELSAAQDTIRAAKGEVEAVKDIRDKIAQRVEAGISDVVDLNQADVAIQRANSDLLAAQTKFDIAAGRFAEMTGIRPHRGASPDEPHDRAAGAGAGGAGSVAECTGRQGSAQRTAQAAVDHSGDETYYHKPWIGGQYELDDVVYSYGPQEKPALTIPKLRIRPGEKIAARRIARGKEVYLNYSL